MLTVNHKPSEAHFETSLEAKRRPLLYLGRDFHRQRALPLPQERQARLAIIHIQTEAQGIKAPFL